LDQKEFRIKEREITSARVFRLKVKLLELLIKKKSKKKFLKQSSGPYKGYNKGSQDFILQFFS